MLMLMNFNRRPHERIDDLIHRFEAVVHPAAAGQLTMNLQRLVRLRLRSAGDNEQQMERLLDNTNGRFPQNVQQFNQMLVKLRTMGRIIIRHPHNIASLLRPASFNQNQ